MALQSQSMRNSNIRSSDSLGKAKRKGQRRLIGMAILVLALGAGFIVVVRFRDKIPGFGPRAAKADPTAGLVSNPGMPAKPVTPPAPKPEPTILEMGSKARPGAPTLPTSNPTTAKPPAPTVDLPGSTPTTKPSLTTKSDMPGSSPAAPSAGTTTNSTTAGTTATPKPGTPTTPTTTATGPTTTPPAPPAPTTETSGLPSELVAARAQAEKAMAERQLVEARTSFNTILTDARITESDRNAIRQSMATINKELVFSGAVFANDPLCVSYKVVSGDALVKITRKLGAVTEANLIARVNNVNPNAIQVGQDLKVLKGPFHAVVNKAAFRMDIFAGPTPSPGSIGSHNLGAGAEPGWVYIRSFPVGLGENGKTPVGGFVVRDGSKMINPPWKNPKTGESFTGTDPKNPIGHRWIGLSGMDEKTQGFLGYGVHGTIDPTSIGKEMSMGCVRMMDDDVSIVYDMLMPRSSVVKIMP